MRRPSPEEIDSYCERYQVTAEVAWRDYLQLRLAEAVSRDNDLLELCIWKGAFVMRFVLQSARASGDLDATIGLNRDRVDERRIRQRLIKACEDLGVIIPKATLDRGDDSLSFAPIEWTEPEVGTVRTSIDLSLREDLALSPQKRRIDAGLVPSFEVFHIDLNEQTAEKMRCLVQRDKTGDGYDVSLLWAWRANLDETTIRRVVPSKLTSGKDHKATALARVERRHQIWESQRGRELPRDAPTADEMRASCRAAIERWIP